MKNQVLTLGAMGFMVCCHSLAALPVYAMNHPQVLLSQTTPASTTVKQPTPALPFGLPDGTPIKLKFTQAISSKTAKANDPVQFEVAEDVKIGTTVVIAKGAPASGVITKAESAGMLGRKGKLEIDLKEVTLVSGERVTLRGNQESGGGNSTTTLALSAAISPFFLLMSGKNVNYEAGTEFTAFVNGNFELDPSKFPAPSSSPTSK